MNACEFLWITLARSGCVPTLTRPGWGCRRRRPGLVGVGACRRSRVGCPSSARMGGCGQARSSTRAAPLAARRGVGRLGNAGRLRRAGRGVVREAWPRGGERGGERVGWVSRRDELSPLSGSLNPSGWLARQCGALDVRLRPLGRAGVLLPAGSAIASMGDWQVSPEEGRGLLSSGVAPGACFWAGVCPYR